MQKIVDEAKVKDTENAEAQLKLEKAKESAKAEIEEVAKAKIEEINNIVGASEEDKQAAIAKVEEAKNAAISEVEKAEDVLGVTSAKETGIENIKNIENPKENSNTGSNRPSTPSTEEETNIKNLNIAIDKAVDLLKSNISHNINVSIELIEALQRAIDVRND